MANTPTPHIAANPGDFAQTVLMPGDPLRAAARKSEVFVAGGIKPNTVENYLAAGADVIIVGAGITKAEDPVAAARAFREKIQ